MEAVSHRFAACFEGLGDPRSDNAALHDFHAQLVIALLVITLCGGQAPWSAPYTLRARSLDSHEAARLNQSRPFLMRLDMLAKLPLTAAWFPDFGLPGQGVIAVAPRACRSN